MEIHIHSSALTARIGSSTDQGLYNNGTAREDSIGGNLKGYKRRGEREQRGRGGIGLGGFVGGRKRKNMDNEVELVMDIYSGQELKKGEAGTGLAIGCQTFPVLYTD